MAFRSPQHGAGQTDTIKTVRRLVQRKRLDPTMMPVYRLVPRNGVLEPTEIIPPTKPSTRRP
jgi:hypothetical protein